MAINYIQNSPLIMLSSAELIGVFSARLFEERSDEFLVLPINVSNARKPIGHDCWGVFLFGFFILDKQNKETPSRGMSDLLVTERMDSRSAQAALSNSVIHLIHDND